MKQEVGCVIKLKTRLKTKNSEREAHSMLPSVAGYMYVVCMQLKEPHHMNPHPPISGVAPLTCKSASFSVKPLKKHVTT